MTGIDKHKGCLGGRKTALPCLLPHFSTCHCCGSCGSWSDHWYQECYGFSLIKWSILYVISIIHLSTTWPSTRWSIRQLIQLLPPWCRQSAEQQQLRWEDVGKWYQPSLKTNPVNIGTFGTLGIHSASEEWSTTLFLAIFFIFINIQGFQLG